MDGKEVMEITLSRHRLCYDCSQTTDEIKK